MKIEKNIYCHLISTENIFDAWRGFRRGKNRKEDVLCFERNLESNLFCLLDDLTTMNYQHGGYQRFYVYDPKFRIINKAEVRDRVVHHLVYKKLCQIYEPCFIRDSYSSRIGRGSHLAVANLRKELRRAGNNFHKQIFALKGDVKKFFDNINHGVLLNVLSKKIHDHDFLWLIRQIVFSFGKGKSLPLGNVTSQIFANVYLNELDQFVVRELRPRYYSRYADDFIMIANNGCYLKTAVQMIKDFLMDNLALSLHEGKTKIRKFGQGLDFCGYVALPRYCRLRTKTARRMIKKSTNNFADYLSGRIDDRQSAQYLSSYLAMLKHCCGRYLLNRLLR